jgi:serine/threonine protein kinase
MTTPDRGQASLPLADEYGNLHYLDVELARGGQGVVFRTMDADLAIKQPLDASGQPDKNADLRGRFRSIRLLPIPHRIPMSLPLAILRDEPGYVMRLLSEMHPFSVFELDGKTKKSMAERTPGLPAWLAAIPDKEMALRLCHYADTGSTRRRLLALSKCASILARLHNVGLVYGDISPNNAFVGSDSSRDVWLIDADNLRFELTSGGASVYTPGYGAPEVVQGLDQSRPRTDCWAFAVMAFKLLAICHPFIGRRVLAPDTDDAGWDAEWIADGPRVDLDEQAYAGYFPFIDDSENDSNRGAGGLPRSLVTTPALRALFQETFGTGRTQPHRRPVMGFWALELARAFDMSLDCSECGMSYFARDYTRCPYCCASRGTLIRASTPRWEIVIPSTAEQFCLPHRLFHPFSYEKNDDTEHEAVLNVTEKSAWPVRGTKPFPEELAFEFVEAER